jgi:hypothetical protein
MSNEIKLHRGQSEVLKYLFSEKTGTRYAATVASRGFGKSYLASVAATMAVHELLEMPEDTPNKNVSIICPTYQQSLDIYWPLLAYNLGLEDYAEKSSQTAGTFWFQNNVKLKLWSYEASERMRGSGQYFVVGDEVSDWTGQPGLKESWESIIQPAMTTRWAGNHKALIIGTPKGMNYFYDMCNFETLDNRWKTFRYTYRDSPYLSTEEIERTKRLIDPMKFAREYECSFEDSGAKVFYMFDRKTHVTADLPYFSSDTANKEDVHVAIDFNIGIMAAVVFAVRAGQIHILEDMQNVLDTEQLAKKLKGQFKDKGHRVFAYPDPAGRARKTSAVAGATDFSILESHGIICRAHKAAPPIVDSVAAVNRKFKNANGDIDMYVHPRAEHTIRSLERTIWVENNPNTAQISKTENIEHWTDALRYAVEYLFPVRSGTKTVTKGFMF